MYLKPPTSHHPGNSSSFIASTGKWTSNLNAIFDHVETMAQTRLSQTASEATLDFRMHLIHGDSLRTKPPVVIRPDYSSHERREGNVGNGSVDGHGSENDDDESVNGREEQSPVFALTFTRTGAKVRITHCNADQDVLGCRWNGGCSRCRPAGE